MSEAERALRRRKKEALTIARQARYSVEVLDRIKNAQKDIEIDWALAQGRRAL